MGNKVTFDYSKASCFVSEAEVASMEKLVAGSKGRAGIQIRRRK